jgi:3-oxoacyl-[acyl-carrier protein] reductase
MLTGKVAFVTGSTRGIGWAIAEEFARHGASIVLNGLSNQNALDTRVQELSEQFKVPVKGILCDVTSSQNLKSVYQDIFKEFGRLDVLVNNAGILKDALMGMIPDALVEESFRVNTYSVIYNMQLASRLMQRNNSGSIINITSIIGTNGNAGQTVYGATKAAVIGATKSAAKELAPKNIRVNAIAPGFIDTDMIKTLTEKVKAERLASVAMGRIGKPSDVAKTAVYLASQLAEYVTGQVIGVDGGMLI